MSQDKLQTMVMQTFWGVIEVYYGIVQVVNVFLNSSAWKSSLIRQDFHQASKDNSGNKDKLYTPTNSKKRNTL